MDSNTINNKTQTRIPPPRGYALSGKIMLSAIVVLFSVVLIILFVHLYVRWRVYRRRSLRRRRNPLIFAAAGDPSPPSPAISRGLDPAVVKSLHVSLFSAEDLEDDDVAECAVCINEFEEGDKVRVLPRCGHRFHIACIDMWFGSHNSCPLCRSAVEVEESAESPAAARGQRCYPATGSSSENQEVRIEIGRREEEVGVGLGFGRILAIKKLLFGDFRINREEGDIERGEAVGGAPAAVAASVA